MYTQVQASLSTTSNSLLYIPSARLPPSNKGIRMALKKAQKNAEGFSS
jgi:hypothetical protein